MKTVGFIELPPTADFFDVAHRENQQGLPRLAEGGGSYLHLQALALLVLQRDIVTPACTFFANFLSEDDQSRNEPSA
ncbi:MAG: hypothetical protein AABZ84_01585 [Pseudomonadota bacterium]